MFLIVRMFMVVDDVLMTPAEVAGLAFGDNPGFDAALIGKSAIVAAQEKFIKPALGMLFEALCGRKYGEFLEGYVKPALAVYVKLLLLPGLAVKVGNCGLTQHGSANFSPPGAEPLDDLYRALRSEGDTLLRRAVGYVEGHRADFPEYDPRGNPANGVRIVGDIMF